MCFVFTFVDYTISTERFLKPITFAQILYPSLTKLILPFAIGWNCRDRDVTWLRVPEAEHFPGNTGFGQCWILVDRSICGIYAFCRRRKEGYLFFIFPISCFFVHDVFTHMVFAAIELTPFFLIQTIAFQYLVKWAWGPRQMGGEARLEAMEWVIGKWSWIYWAPVLAYLFVDYLWVSSRSSWAGRKPTVTLCRQMLTFVLTEKCLCININARSTPDLWSLVSLKPSRAAVRTRLSVYLAQHLCWSIHSSTHTFPKETPFMEGYDWPTTVICISISRQNLHCYAGKHMLLTSAVSC